MTHSAKLRWGPAEIATLAEERKTMTLDALGEKYDVSPGRIWGVLNREWKAAYARGRNESP